MVLLLLAGAVVGLWLVVLPFWVGAVVMTAWVMVEMTLAGGGVTVLTIVLVTAVMTPVVEGAAAVTAVLVMAVMTLVMGEVMVVTTVLVANVLAMPVLVTAMTPGVREATVVTTV